MPVGGSYTTDYERMRIDSTGNVGIGTSNPAYKMHLNNSGALTIGISDGTEIWQIDNGVEAAGILFYNRKWSSKKAGYRK